MTSEPAAYDPRAVPVRDAATVMLVRDGGPGLEVFMLRRTLGAVFASGVYVFPGGGVDDADRAGDVERVCRDRDDAAASAILGVPSGGLAYFVSAVRECFEEAGVLLAAPAADPGTAVRFDDPAVAARFAEARRAVNDGQLRLVELCGREDLVITAGAIEYVSHWITPIGERRRFDTRFFLARAPVAQEPLHDDGETIASLWVRPAEALERREAGELSMLPPTIRNLEFLAGFDHADEALAAARALPRPEAIRPRLKRDGEGRISVVLPEEPEYATLPDVLGDPLGPAPEPEVGRRW